MSDQSRYSVLISPHDYDNQISRQHLYIGSADEIQRKRVHQLTAIKRSRPYEVVDLGCGPGRTLAKYAELANIRLTGVDSDPVFLEHAQRNLEQLRRGTDRVRLVRADIMSYRHDRPIDIAISMGVHHHLSSGDRSDYLNNLSEQLVPGGQYLLGDEFLAPHHDENDRRIIAVLWYSHIIAAARRRAYAGLAREEAKTLLDDLQIFSQGSFKTEGQIELAMEMAESIDRLSRRSRYAEAQAVARHTLIELDRLAGHQPSGDNLLDLSRGDYKVDLGTVMRELSDVGFRVVGVHTFGPALTVGCLAVIEAQTAPPR